MEASATQPADSVSNPLMQEDSSSPAAGTSSTASGLTHFVDLSASPGAASTAEPEARPQQHVELSYLSECSPSGRGSPSTISSRQFDRTNSYTAMNSSFSAGAGTRSNSLMEVQQLESCAHEAGRQATRLMQRCSFEVFEMEEQEATEVKYLRGALTKKVRTCCAVSLQNGDSKAALATASMCSFSGFLLRLLHFHCLRYS